MVIYRKEEKSTHCTYTHKRKEGGGMRLGSRETKRRREDIQEDWKEWRERRRNEMRSEMEARNGEKEEREGKKENNRGR